MRLPLILAAAIPLLISCGAGPEPEKRVEPTVDVSAFGGTRDAQEWTGTVLAALGSHGAPLIDTVPADIGVYCPAYAEADAEDRKAFWVTLLSALAKHESTWRADASGGGGAWLGLLQISPRTAQGYGCRANSPDALKDGGANLSCGIRIMAVTVPRDGVISAGMRGVAADWGPFHQASKRTDIQAMTRRTPACRG